MFLLKKVCLSLALPVLIAVSALFLPGCSSQNPLNEWMRPGEKKKILSTTAQIGDLAAAVGGERIDGWVLIQGDLDPHSYEIVKGDGEKFERADLIFYNGLGLEHGASLSALLKDAPKAVALGEKIASAVPEKILKKGSATDPHIWMDISLWKEAIGPIVEALGRIDPEGAAYYQERGESLAAKLDQAHSALQSQLSKIPSEKRYLVTSHDAFQYFTRSYLADPQEQDHWRGRFSAPEGLAPDGQLNPLDIQRIIDFVKAHRIEVIFPESNVSRDSIKKIAHSSKELGIEIRVCAEPLYGDSMSGLSYLEMMARNADVIQRHLEPAK